MPRAAQALPSIARSRPTHAPEAALGARAGGLACGVDEAGRGPWAGPVTAAAVLLDPDGARLLAEAGLDDSKRLTAARRAALEPLIRDVALAWSVAEAGPAEIDALNVLAATHLAMTRAVSGLPVRAAAALIDGDRAPKGLTCAVETLVGGDGLSLSIAAASVLAKVARDRTMEAACRAHPGYGFSAHKGYGVAAHAKALARLGPCPIHRLSFKPVAIAAAARGRAP